MTTIKEFLSQVTVVDTETTGTVFDESEIVELATGRYNGKWNVLNVLIKPLHDIPPDASAINFISNKMVANQPIFDDLLEVFDEMMDLKHTHLMVAHNSDFDRQMLETSYGRAFAFDRFKPFDEQRRWICTWRLAKAVLGINYKLIKYGLSYLRYHLDLDVPDELVAHRADSDVITCGKLLEKLLELAVEKELLSLDKDIKEQVIALCWEPIKIESWYIGKKYNGVKLEDIPTNYYMWAIEHIDELNEKNARYNSDLATSVTKILESRL